MRLDTQFFKKIVSEVIFTGCEAPVFKNFVIDSRLAKKDSTFVALQGEYVDGHDFIADALKNGATGLLLSKEKQNVLKKIDKKLFKKISIALVPNVYEALVKLAAAWRAQFDCDVIGITGSVGKTSTKEMLANIIRVSGKKCLASRGNYNTVIGISLTLLDLRPEHDCAVIEMGVNRRGEMAKMAELVRPTLAIVTSIAHSHMESLGSLSDIAAEKRQIFSCFKENNIGIINGDQPILASIAYPHPVVKFGYKTTNQIQARKVQVHGTQTKFILKIYGERYPITLSTIHAGPLVNTLACAAAAYFLKIDAKYIVDGVQKAAIVPGRFEPRTLRNKKGLLINDCYNANPESMKEALRAFERLETSGKKIAVLGDMLELGVNTPFWHRQLGRALRKSPSLDHIIFVGKHIKAAEKTAPLNIPFITVLTWQEAITELEQSLEDGAAVLVKASNGVGLKNLVEKIACT